MNERGVTCSARCGAWLRPSATNETVETSRTMAAAGFRRFLYRLTDREPVVVFSVAIGMVGIGLPLVVVPIRESAGYDTSQYHGRDNANRLWLKSMTGGGQGAVAEVSGSATFELSDGVGSIPVTK